MCEYFLAQCGYVDVSIDLRCLNVLVAQHFLYCPEVGASLEQFGSKRVAQRMWRHRLGYACVVGSALYHYQYHGAREVCSSAVEEHVFVFAGFDVHEVAVVEPQLQFVQGVGRYGHEALLVALARDAQVAVCGENVGTVITKD